MPLCLNRQCDRTLGARSRRALRRRRRRGLPGCSALSTYDAFGVFGTIFRALEWKTPIFCWRVVPKSPNASYPRLPLTVPTGTGVARANGRGRAPAGRRLRARRASSFASPRALRVLNHKSSGYGGFVWARAGRVTAQNGCFRPGQRSTRQSSTKRAGAGPGRAPRRPRPRTATRIRRRGRRRRGPATPRACRRPPRAR